MKNEKCVANKVSTLSKERCVGNKKCKVKNSIANFA